MKIKSLQNALCVVMVAIFPAHQILQAEGPTSAGTPPETLFAYKSSFWAYLHDALFGYTVIPSDVPVEVTPVDPSAWANATINSTVTFRVLHDVVGQYKYADGGNTDRGKGDADSRGKASNSPRKDGAAGHGG